MCVQCVNSLYRDEKFQALHTTQLLASRVSDLKSSINEMSTTIKVDVNAAMLVVADLSSRWLQCQQAMENGNLWYIVLYTTHSHSFLGLLNKLVWACSIYS